MARTAPRAKPGYEAVTWDGTNDDDVLDLVERVAALNVWAPLAEGPLRMRVNQADEVHPGLNIYIERGHPDEKWWRGDLVVARVEEGNTLVFDPFAATPLSVMVPDDYNLFYGGDS